MLLNLMLASLIARRTLGPAPCSDVEFDEIIRRAQVTAAPLDARSRRDHRVRRHTAREPHIAADAATTTDHGLAAEDRGVGIDHYVIADRRVALHVLQALVDTRSAQGHSLIQPDARAKHGGLADHDARTVVDRERRSDPRTGMDVDPGRAARGLPGEARIPRTAAVKLMRDPVRG